MQALQLLPVVVAGYLLGSIPTGVLLARLFGWPDPRTHGSGHIGGLNSLRGGGLVAGVLVALGDLAKGFAAVWLAEHLSPGPWAIPLGGVAAVIGHNWPVWLGFSGGMGLATAGGAVAERNPLLLLPAIAVWGLARLLIRHSPRATIFTMLTVPALAWALGLEPATFWLATGCAAVIALRHLPDWNRTYE